MDEDWEDNSSERQERVKERDEKKGKKDRSVAVKKYNKPEVLERVRGNPWIVSTFVFGILALVLILSNFSLNVTGNVSKDVAAANLMKFLSENVQGEVTLMDVSEENGLYRMDVEYQGQTIPVYVTKNGKYTASYLQALSDESESSSSSETNVPKSDKPVVELFVMSYCPYGTQAEKGILPVVELLGDKIDFKIRYVYYAMHGEKEIQENLREYCIQKEQEEKFVEYMNCFLEGDGKKDSSGYITNGNDINTCLAKTGIDTGKLSSCMDNADGEFSVTKNFEDESSWLSGYYPLFDVDKELNEEYNVGGSPTLIINGVEASSSRTPSAYLSAICNAFEDKPEECSTTLSSETPSVYFGWEATGTSTTASCG